MGWLRWRGENFFAGNLEVDNSRHVKEKSQGIRCDAEEANPVSDFPDAESTPPSREIQSCVVCC